MECPCLLPNHNSVASARLCMRLLDLHKLPEALKKVHRTSASRDVLCDALYFTKYC